MSVLINGMEMPKPKLADMATIYGAYIIVSPNGHAAIVVENEDGLDTTEYPLVPVPPHGRLIDADGEITVNITMMPGGKCKVDFIAPVVIPAEEEKT